MAKMMNPNAVSPMTLVNAKAQTKQGQLIQKIGKGKRRVQVTLSKGVRSYLNAYIKESRKQMLQYEKQIPNVFQFFNYIEKETLITKENKKEKEKNIQLSYEELDYLKLGLKQLVSGADNIRKTLKWYQFIEKFRYNFSKKQGELTLEELGNTSKVENKKK